MAESKYVSWRKELVSLLTILSLLGGQTIHGIVQMREGGSREEWKRGEGSVLRGGQKEAGR